MTAPEPGWALVSLGDLVVDRSSITYGVLKPGPYDAAGVPMVKIQDLAGGSVDGTNLHYISRRLSDKYKRTILRGGEVLISIQGTIGRVAVVPKSLQGANISRTLAVIRPESDSLAKWLRYALESPQVTNQLPSIIGGSTRDSLNLRDLRTLRIPLAPPEERPRIIERLEAQLSRLDAGVAALEGVQANLKRYRAAVLKAACEGRLVPTEAELARRDSRSYEPASFLIQESSGSSRRRALMAVAEAVRSRPMPDGWASANFADVCEPVSDEGRRVKQRDYAADGTYPVVDQGERLVGGFTDDADMLYRGPLPVLVFGDHTRRFKLIDFPFAVGADGVKLIRPKACWEPRFLLSAFQSLVFEDRGYSRHFQFIRRAMLPVPPLAEQHRIVAELECRLSLADDLDGIVTTNLHHGYRLRQSVLAAAFRGPTENSQSTTLIHSGPRPETWKEKSGATNESP